MNNRSFAWLLALLLLIGIGALVLPQTGWFDRPVGRGVDILAQNEAEQPNANRIEAPTLSKALGVAEEDLVEVGGIKRPKRDIAEANSTAGAESTAESSKPDPFEKSVFGTIDEVPKVPADANEQVAGLYKELTSENPPLAARSAMFEPEPFDLEKYKAEPQAWLNQIRPGRAYESAQPGENVKRLEARSPLFHHVLQGEKVILEAAADPGMPVTFYTPQVGEFENRLTTHSVAANEEGVARTVYTAVSGTMGIVDVLAASPVHSNQLQFKIKVALPE